MIPVDRLKRPGLRTFSRRKWALESFPRSLRSSAAWLGQNLLAVLTAKLSSESRFGGIFPPNTHSGAGFRPLQLCVRTVLGTKVLLPEVTRSPPKVMRQSGGILPPVGNLGWPFGDPPVGLSESLSITSGLTGRFQSLPGALLPTPPLKQQCAVGTAEAEGVRHGVFEGRDVARVVGDKVHVAGFGVLIVQIYGWRQDLIP